MRMTTEQFIQFIYAITFCAQKFSLSKFIGSLCVWIHRAQSMPISINCILNGMLCWIGCHCAAVFSSLSLSLFSSSSLSGNIFLHLWILIKIKSDIIKFSVTYSLYFIARIRTRMLRCDGIVQISKICLPEENWKYLYVIPLNWIPILSADTFGWCFFFAFSAISIAFVRCHIALAASSRANDNDIRLTWAQPNAPDYSHYFSRFIGKSHCRVIIITIVTLKLTLFRSGVALLYSSAQLHDERALFYLMSVWPIPHMFEDVQRDDIM